MTFRLPDTTQRLAINGRNGSGKTMFASWILSQAAFDKIPYVIVDYKEEDLIKQIDYARPLEFREKLPARPGLYVLHPVPKVDDVALEQWLWRVWKRGNLGLYFDEAHAVPVRSGAFQAILTQGRSKHIPAIVISQRPSLVSRFVFSEANFYAMFHLNDKRDRETVAAFTPVGEHAEWDMDRTPPPFTARWYDQSAHWSAWLAPCPDEAVILDTFRRRLAPKRRWI